MTFKVVKLTVGKGKTTSDEKAGEWNRQYFEAEAVIEDESQLELAKNSLEALLDMWLKGESLQSEKPSWDPAKIKWEKAEGGSGPYERSEDIDNLEFKAMLKDLAAHKGRLTIDGYFYWIFENGCTVGRKLIKKSTEQQPQPKTQKLEEIKALFPSDLQGFLNFEIKENFCEIKPRQFLGSESFAKVADIVKAKGGDYVSAGKQSHFRIPVATS